VTRPAGSRPFRFGALTTGGTDASRGRWPDHARKIEASGFDTLLVADHFLNETVCTPRLAAAAIATTALRLGSYVYDNDFRHPVLLAREAAEIDVLSGGRMELGIGAGWAKSEYDAVGITFDDGPTRVSRYEEAVGIIRALHCGETVTHHGRFYDLDACDLLIQPVQDPIPLLLGGGGPRMTRFAGARADIVGFVPRSLPDGGLDPTEFSVAAFDEKITLLEAAVGDRPDGGPERSVLIFEHARTADALPRGEDAWTDPEWYRDSPYALIGEPAEMIELLLERRERWGLSYIVCWEEDADALAPVVAALAGR